MPQFISITIDPKFQQSVLAFSAKLSLIETRLQTVNRAIWESVNSYLEEQVLQTWQQNRAGHGLNEKTIERKKRYVARAAKGEKLYGAPQPTGETAKAEYIYEYGRLTGWWVEQFSRHWPVGTDDLFIRRTRDAPSVSGGVLLWGIDLAKVFRGYPGFILKPGSRSRLLSGEGAVDALISVSQTEYEWIRRAFLAQHFMPALAAAGFSRSS